MSAADRAARAHENEERRLVAAVEEGMRQTLQSADGRAFLWWFYARTAGVEDADADPGRRFVGIELAKAAKQADWEGWQLMREENEKPKRRKAQAQETQEDDDGEE